MDREMAPGRRVVVTGTTRGLGRVAAQWLLERGHFVGLNYRDSPRQAWDLHSRFPATSMLLDFDVRDHRSVASSLKDFSSRFDGLDVLVNNAAHSGAPSLFIRYSGDFMQDLFATNVTGTANCCRTAASLMIRRGRGLIINVSSVAAAAPSAGLSIYAASKCAIEMLTQCLAIEVGRHGVSVTALRLPPVLDHGMFARLSEKQRREAETALGCAPICSTQAARRIEELVLIDDHARLNGSIVELRDEDETEPPACWKPPSCRGSRHT